MKIDINEVKRLYTEIDKINDIPFKDIDWYDGNTRLEFPPQILTSWHYAGLNNTHFIITGFYEDKK